LYGTPSTTSAGKKQNSVVDVNTGSGESMTSEDWEFDGTGWTSKKTGAHVGGTQPPWTRGGARGGG